MPEGFGNFEGFTGEGGGKEKTQESNEKFQERYRQAQTQIKQIKREEKRKKQDDNSLASIIVQFLGEKNHTELFVLISQLIAKNVPSDFILAILSLIHNASAHIVDQKFAETILKIQAPSTKGAFRQGENEIQQWIKRIFSTATPQPHKILETCLDKDWQLHTALIQLTSFVLREFLENKHEKEINFENLRNFCKTFLKNLIKKLEYQVHNQGLLDK